MNKDNSKRRVYLWGIVITASLLSTIGYSVFKYSGINELYYYFNPPSDYYKSLSTVEVTPNQLEYSLSLRHKYQGSYELKLAWPKEDSREHPIPSNIAVNFLLNGVVTFSPKALVFRPYTSREKTGVILFEYAVPSDVPADSIVTCEIKFRQKISKSNYPISLEIAKAGL